MPVIKFEQTNKDLKMIKAIAANIVDHYFWHLRPGERTFLEGVAEGDEIKSRKQFAWFMSIVERFK